MGQYHKVANLTKREFFDPHTLHCGAKAVEMVGCKGCGDALLMLVACPIPRGGGDFNEHPMMGRWHGDNIAMIGDYAEDVDIPGIPVAKLYGDMVDGNGWTNIASKVMDMLNKQR